MQRQIRPKQLFLILYASLSLLDNLPDYLDKNLSHKSLERKKSSTPHSHRSGRSPRTPTGATHSLTMWICHVKNPHLGDVKLCPLPRCFHSSSRPHELTLSHSSKILLFLCMHMFPMIFWSSLSH